MSFTKHNFGVVHHPLCSLCNCSPDQYVCVLSAAMLLGVGVSLPSPPFWL